MQLKVLKDLPGYKAGQKVRIKTNNDIPVDRFWRDRLRDAEIDGCVEIVKPIRKERKVTDD